MVPTSYHASQNSNGQIRLRSMLRAIRNSNVSVLYQTPDLLYAWAENVPDFWNLQWRQGITDEQFLPKINAEKLLIAKAQLLESGEAQRLELSFTDKNTQRWYEFFVDSDKDEAGEIIGIVTTAVEISELKHREQVLKILLREVSHRSKNLLAIIQSIAMQTARYSGTIEQFLHKFRGRIYSLSHSQDLVTDSDWHGASLHDLLYAQLEKYVHPKDPRLKLEGKDIYLFPGAALHIGLALHELIVNSTSYGALALENGQIRLSASLEPNEQNEMDLILHWKETSSVSATSDTDETDPFLSAARKNPPDNSRFGSAVLLRVVPQAVNGTAFYTIEDNILNYVLRVPHRNFDF